MNKFNIAIIIIFISMIAVYSVNAVASLSHNVPPTTRINTSNYIIINITNNITNYVASWNNITNNITNYINITNFIENNITQNITSMIFIENNITNNISINQTIYAGQFYNITNNITEYQNNTYNITNNISFNYYYYMVSWSKYILSNGTTPYIDFNESELNNTIRDIASQYNTTINNTINNFIDNTILSVLEKGTGYMSIKSNDVKGIGQIQLINGYNHLIGINTTFIGGGIQNLDAYYSFYINNTIYYAYPINNNTDANLTSTLFGNQTAWNGENITTDLILSVNVANDSFCIATGYQTKAVMPYAFASGYKSEANGLYSVAFGNNNIANNQNTFAFGSNNIASGILSTTFGFNNIASGNTAFVLGQNNVASGTYAFASGYNTNANGQSSATFGENTYTYGKNSVAIGFNANATSYGELVIGRYNTLFNSTFNSWNANDPALEIGIGSSATNRSNALTVFKNGNINMSGKLIIARNITMLNSSGTAYCCQIRNITFGCSIGVC